MKKLNYYFFIFIAASLLFAACGKDGAVGPTGATGPQGAVGPAGPAGPNGANGSVIYSGATTPPSTTGNTGDFYLDLGNGLLFGPKTATGWGTGFSLIGATGATGANGPVGPTGAKGATGAAGAAGSQIYSGNGAPPNSIGVNGDYYLDKTNYLLYGPKTAGGWGTPIALQGPAGPQGPQGPEGNANVMTDVFSVGGNQWLWNSNYLYETSSSSYTEYFTRYYVRLNTTVTQNVLNDGLVLVYFTPAPTNQPNQWLPLPYQFDSGNGYTFNYVYQTAVGQVTLEYFFIQTDPTATLPTLSTYNDETRNFKIVTITGTTGNFLVAHHVNLNNYQEVSRVTGIWQQDK
jgi:hypothetical protein